MTESAFVGELRRILALYPAGGNVPSDILTVPTAPPIYDVAYNRAAKAIMDKEFHRRKWTNCNFKDDPTISFLIHDSARYEVIAHKYPGVNLIRFDLFLLTNSVYFLLQRVLCWEKEN
jgi:hypothetical protein